MNHWIAIESQNDTTCPHHANNCELIPGDHNLVSRDIGLPPSYVAIVSSCFSCFGSVMILMAFLLFRDVRSGIAQRIITFLAIADFFSALGYIIGSINFLIFFNEPDPRRCKVFDGVCKAQAFLTTWSSMSSFAWTTILAIYFYLILVYLRRPFRSKLQQAVLHTLAWGAPVLVVIPLMVLDRLGYAKYAASNWCFVKDRITPSTSTMPTNSSAYGQSVNNILIVMVAGKFWELLTYILVIFLYTHIAIFLKVRRGVYDELQPAVRGNVERRLKFIPVIFLLLRIWGTIQFFFSIIVKAIHPDVNGCNLKSFYYIFYVLGVLQAIGDPGQGWGNAILYVFMSKMIRKRLILKPLSRCCLLINQRLGSVITDSDDGNAGQPQEDERGDRYREDTITSAPGPIDEAKPGPIDNITPVLAL